MIVQLPPDFIPEETSNDVTVSEGSQASYQNTLFIKLIKLRFVYYKENNIYIFRNGIGNFCQDQDSVNYIFLTCICTSQNIIQYIKIII